MSKRRKHEVPAVTSVHCTRGRKHFKCELKFDQSLLEQRPEYAKIWKKFKDLKPDFMSLRNIDQMTMTPDHFSLFFKEKTDCKYHLGKDKRYGHLMCRHKKNKEK